LVDLSRELEELFGAQRPFVPFGFIRVAIGLRRIFLEIFRHGRL
jgi:hypothetical protein